MGGHTKWADIKHKATPEQLAEARAALDQDRRSWKRLRAEALDAKPGAAVLAEQMKAELLAELEAAREK